MKKYTFILICFLAMLFAATVACAQKVGFTDQQNSPQQFGYGGFTGQSQVVTVAQAQTFNHKTPVIVRGTIVRAVGNDWYVFRDSSGEISVKIKQKAWHGQQIGSSDTVEISGQIHNKDWNKPSEIRAKFIKKI